LKILHVFSNWKWTGPAEPAVRLAASLADAGHDVTFACGACPYPDLENLVASQARRRGLRLVDGLRLRKHFDPLTGMRDLGRLTRLLREDRFDVVHAHLLNDHLLAGAAARRSGAAPRVVRSVYGGRDLAPRLRSRIAFGRLADGVIAASEDAAAAVRARAAFPEDRLFVVPVAVEVERFAPAVLAAERAQARRDLGLADGDVAAGLVARIQRHRRFELLIEAFARAVETAPRLRLVLIGRGTHEDEVAREPVERLGLGGRVVFAGFRAGEAYVAALAALDVGLFLVPGSDGSCRAARELCAAGLPLVVTRRPPLPEIVQHERSGFVVGESVEEFAGALARLANDAELRRAMGRESLAHAAAAFAPDAQRRAVEDAYERVRSAPPRGGSGA
jgi:glycosyltransferase involved in cell wall biosynthesis